MCLSSDLADFGSAGNFCLTKAKGKHFKCHVEKEGEVKKGELKLVEHAKS